MNDNDARTRKAAPDERVVLLDFGLARRFRERSASRAPSVVIN